jgi:hypothetical protein
MAGGRDRGGVILGVSFLPSLLLPHNLLPHQRKNKRAINNLRTDDRFSSGV